MTFTQRVWGGLAALAFGLVLTAPPAQAQLFSKTTLDRSYCQVTAPRQTVVYIDDTVMIDGQTDWAVRLSTKLRGSLVHGERVTIVRLSPATGQSKEVWNACWPGVTAQERAALKKQTGFFTGDPTEAIDQQVGFFARDFGIALSEIYAAAKQPVDRAAIDPAKPPQREIFRALASDGSRFAQSQVTIRAIVYSNFAENSSLGSVFQPPPIQPLNFRHKLETSLRRGMFYLFGVGVAMGDTSAIDTVRAFWSNGLRSMDAAVGGIGADINLPNVLPSKASTYPVELTFDNQPVDGRLSLLTDADGTLVDSWLSFPRLEYATAGLSGSFICRPNGSCRLNATASSGLVTTSPNEVIVMAGNEKDGLAGHVGVKGAASYPLRVATDPQ